MSTLCLVISIWVHYDWLYSSWVHYYWLYNIWVHYDWLYSINRHSYITEVQIIYFSMHCRCKRAIFYVIIFMWVKTCKIFPLCTIHIVVAHKNSFFSDHSAWTGFVSKYQIILYFFENSTQYQALSDHLQSNHNAHLVTMTETSKVAL